MASAMPDGTAGRSTNPNRQFRVGDAATEVRG